MSFHVFFQFGCSRSFFWKFIYFSSKSCVHFRARVLFTICINIKMKLTKLFTTSKHINNSLNAFLFYCSNLKRIKDAARSSLLNHSCSATHTHINSPTHTHARVRIQTSPIHCFLNVSFDSHFHRKWNKKEDVLRYAQRSVSFVLKFIHSHCDK